MYSLLKIPDVAACNKYVTEVEVMRVQDGWTNIICAVAILILSLGAFLLCIASAKYLGRAKAPDDIDLGFRLSISTKSIWLGIQGSKKKPDSKKDQFPRNGSGLLS